MKTIRTTKLYKTIEGILHYWETWDSSDGPLAKTIVHWGQVGDTGEFVEIIHRSSDALKTHYEEQVQTKRAEGYVEAGLFDMILHFQMDGDSDYLQDVDFRNQLWDHLDELLGWTGNGSASGGDIGSGTCNLLFGPILQAF